MPIKNYTTNIPAKRSVSEISEILTDAGAVSIAVVNEGRTPVEVRFVLPTVAGEQEFRVRASIDGVLASLRRSINAGDHRVQLNWADDTEKGADIAWRIARDWVAATVGIIDAGVADPRQAFLGYAILPDGRTVYERLTGGPMPLALPPAREA